MRCSLKIGTKLGTGAAPPFRDARQVFGKLRRPARTARTRAHL